MPLAYKNVLRQIKLLPDTINLPVRFTQLYDLYVPDTEPCNSWDYYNISASLITDQSRVASPRYSKYRQTCDTISI